MPTSTQAPLSQFQTVTPPIGNISQNGQGVSLGTVDRSQLTSQQLADMLHGTNPLVRHFADAAEATANARGGGASSSLYGQAATNAAFDALTPIASADANRNADVLDENLRNLNAQNIERMGNNTSVQVAGIGAQSQHEAIQEQARQFDQQQANRSQDREWQLADQRASARANQRSTTFNTLLNTIFSDPSYWRDPEAAMGMFNQYSSSIDDMLSTLFPEYQEPPDAGAGGAAPPNRGALPPGGGR